MKYPRLAILGGEARLNSSKSMHPFITWYQWLSTPSYHQVRTQHSFVVHIPFACSITVVSFKPRYPLSSGASSPNDKPQLCIFASQALFKRLALALRCPFAELNLRQRQHAPVAAISHQPPAGRTQAATVSQLSFRYFSFALILDLFFCVAATVNVAVISFLCVCCFFF